MPPDAGQVPVAVGTDQADRSFTVDSFSEWRQRMCTRFVRLDATTDRPEDFQASFRGSQVDGVSLSHISADSHTVQRPLGLIGVDDPHYHEFSLQLTGSGLVVQDGRQGVLRPGDMAVYDTSRPYSLVYGDDVETLVVVVPAGLIGVPAGVLTQLTAVRLPGDTAMGQLVGSFLCQLDQHIGGFDGSSAVRLVHSAVGLIGTLLCTQLDEGAAGGSSGSRLVVSVKHHIEQNLGDPLLCPSSIAGASHVSTRRLHHLSRGEGTTVASWVKARRLERCRLDLVDPLLADDTVTAIAQRWGFVDAGHFSRSFKSAYGVSPHEYRLRWPARSG